jgi:hypothetical protein
MATRTKVPQLPLDLIAQALPRLSRNDLEALTERLIDVLDSIDGDPDTEEDDPSGQHDEDEINYGQGIYLIHHHGPGCMLGDGGL